MKSFKQYISESLDDIMAYSRDRYNNIGKIHSIPGLINPSKDQLAGYLKRVNSARFILHNDQLHVFDSADAIHDDVLRAEHADQRESTKQYGDRVREMYDKKKSVLGSFYDVYHPTEKQFAVGVSYMPKENQWIHDLLRSHPRTAHLLSPDTPIEHRDI